MKNIFLICFSTSIVLIGIEAYLSSTTTSTHSWTAPRELTAAGHFNPGTDAVKTLTPSTDGRRQVSPFMALSNFLTRTSSHRQLTPSAVTNPVFFKGAFLSKAELFVGGVGM